MSENQHSLHDSPVGFTPTVGVVTNRFVDPDSAYRVLTTATGSGFSSFGRIALTDWQESGATGLRFFVRDLDNGSFWSLGREGCPGSAQINSQATPGVFSLEHTENNLRTTLETCVLTDRPAELRRLSFTNISDEVRHLELTSVGVVILNQADAHTAHPTFSKLFLQTEYHAEQRSLLVHRRPRDPEEHHPTMIHAILEKGEVEWETDRACFHQRGNHFGQPAALMTNEPLTGSVGNVLDPVVSLRRKFNLPPGGSTTLTFLLGAGTDKSAALDLATSLAQEAAIDEAFSAARSAAKAQLTRLGISHPEHSYAQHLAAAVLRGDPGLRPLSLPLLPHGSDPANLGRLGIDGGQPLVVVDADLDTTHQMIMMHRCWHELNLTIQLVVMNHPESGPDDLPGLVRLSSVDWTSADWDLLLNTAQLVVTGSPPDVSELAPPVPGCTPPVCAPSCPPKVETTPNLDFYNGWGGFSPDGSEYVINVSSNTSGGLRLPPRPWTNVLANDRLGSIISETGAGTTWCGNSREHRLTPWSNDPLLDPHGDALYLRDETSGDYFSCLPGPTPGGGHYEVRHGQGYSRFKRSGNDLEVDTLIFVHHSEPVRLSKVQVKNLGERPLDFSLFSYSQLVLGGLPEKSGRFVTTSHDSDSGALIALNPTAGPFAGHPAFASLVGDDNLSHQDFSGDRLSFLGAGGDPAQPAALKTPHLDGVTGAGLDPCFALQASFSLEPGETIEAWVLLGQVETPKQFRELMDTLGQPAGCEAAWQATRNFWRHGLDGIKVKTPSAALDLMVNGWLGYQTLACRMRGRTALYQSGGAFGFRDQLQDSMSLLPLWPELTRRQILLHASHQFVEGDVLHWWHPPLSRGIRTRFADDLLWLPFATVEYLKATGDRKIMEEMIPFLTAQPLEPGQDEVFLEPAPAGEEADLYDHCCRALDRSLTLGSHDLPLFGTGDWNDGMNRVGREGRGESVWMGFFLVTIIEGFLPLCLEREDQERHSRYRRYQTNMIHTLNENGWDGGWYRRGYYDDGSPLGSWENKECAIDALAQSWSVLSGVATPSRAVQAMNAVEEHLINDDQQLIRLLTPPFVDTPHDPGYIKGYVAGVRENGGQYTHAALWVVKAMAVLGRRQRAASLLELINPVNHARTPEQVDRYQVEPYVVAADVYGVAPHVGRGGWTWYTGSSGWMLRVALESVLGLQTEGSTLVVAPCVPDQWPGYSITWRVPTGADQSGLTTETIYEIQIDNPDGCSETVLSVSCDGISCPPVDGTARVPLLKDGRTHRLAITLGPSPEDF
jgi:cellobiose phosphorylase